MKIKSNTITSIYYITLFFIIGLPIWFFTTSPSRYALPDISSLMVHSQTIVNRVLINVIDTTSHFDRTTLKAKLVNGQISQNGNILYKYQWFVRQMNEAEEKIYNTTQSLYDLDSAWNELDSHKIKGRLFVVLVNSKLIKQFGKHKFIFGSSRQIYVGVNLDEEAQVEEEDVTLDQIIIQAVTTALQDKADLEEAMIRKDEAMSSKESIKKLLKREVDVIINILPENIDDGLEFVKSNQISQLHRLTDYAFLKESGITELLNIRVMSQMVYYCFPKDFIQSNLEQQSNGQRLMATNKVAEMLTLIESRILEPNNQQSFHLNLIIPSSHHESPLLFINPETGQKSSAILTSYSSGIFFWNNQDHISLAFKSFMRNLIGLPSLQPSISLRKDIFFTRLELDQIMRKIALEQLTNTLLSLESIKRLLMKVRNIVILEEVSIKLNSAVTLSHQSIDSLAKNELSSAFALSSQAFIASESAFFDPSLLSLHYFPEDQKYAVYFPLFLPVCLPLFSSLYHLIKLYLIRSKSEASKS